MHCRIRTVENRMRICADRNDNHHEAKQPREKRNCMPWHPKRPRREALRIQMDFLLIRLRLPYTKATMMHAVLFLSLVMVDCSYIPIDKVAVSKNESKSPFVSLRKLQEQQKSWTDSNERDVTPAPFAATNPTLQPIILTPPSDPPTSKPFSVPVQIDSSTQKPILVPNNESQEIIPTGLPSIDFSEVPSHEPTRRPSPRPTAAASQMPSAIPSEAPSKERSLQPSSAPTDRFTQGLESEEGKSDVNLTPVSMPIRFKARLEGVREDDVDELLPRVATIWQTFFREALEKEFGQSSFSSVQLAVTAENERRRLRSLQTNKVVKVLDIYAKGQISMRFDNGEAAAKKEELRSFLVTTISRENLQNALTSSNTNFAVTVDGQNESKQTVDDDPKLWEIILGFTILVIAVGTIVFWAMFFWRKRQKRIRKKKLAAIRSAPMGVQSTGTASDMHTSSFLAKPTTHMTIRPLSEGPRQSTPAHYDVKPNALIGGGLTDKDSDDDDSVAKGPRSDDSDSGSDFGRQLRMAASLDKASWEQFQRQKQALEIAARSGISSGGEHDGISDRYDSSLYEIGTQDEHQGIEVEHGGMHPMIFPYGDEKGLSASKNRRSTYAADRYGTQDHGDSEPYGDLKDVPLGKGPYQLSRNELGDHGSLDDQSDSSLRASPTGSSWSGGDLTDMDETIGTLSMLKEVEQLSQYVHHYEQKRESRKMRELELKQREFQNKQRLHLAMTTGSPERKERLSLDIIPTRAHSAYPDQLLMSQQAPSKPGDQTDEIGADYPGDGPREAYAIPRRSVLPSSFESFHSSTDLSDAEDDVSQRLGITPQYPLVSDNYSNINNKKDRPETKAHQRVDAENLNEDMQRSNDRRPSTQSKSESQYHSASVPYATSGAAISDSNLSVKNSRSRTQSHGEETHFDRQPGPSKPLHSRSAPGKISNIVTMFESKPHTAVIPPSPSWQYEN